MSVTPMHVVEPTPDADLVALLEALLEEARAGNILSLAGVTVNVGGETSEFISLGDRPWPVALVGELELLKRRVITKYVEE